MTYSIKHKKKGKEKLIRVQITTIRHGGFRPLGSRVIDLSNVTPSPYLLSDVKN